MRLSPGRSKSPLPTGPRRSPRSHPDSRACQPHDCGRDDTTQQSQQNRQCNTSGGGSFSESLKNLEKKREYATRGPAFWTPDRESQLATLWEQETHLYDPDDDNYRNAQLRKDTYERFATAIGCDGNYCP